MHPLPLSFQTQNFGVLVVIIVITNNLPFLCAEPFFLTKEDGTFEFYSKFSFMREKNCSYIQNQGFLKKKKKKQRTHNNKNKHTNQKQTHRPKNLILAKPNLSSCRIPRIPQGKASKHTN